MRVKGFHDIKTSLEILRVSKSQGFGNIHFGINSGISREASSITHTEKQDISSGEWRIKQFKKPASLKPLPLTKEENKELRGMIIGILIPAISEMKQFAEEGIAGAKEELERMLQQLYRAQKKATPFN